MYDFSKWTDATAALPWGAQRALHDTLSLVADGSVTLVHGADYQNGSPCLINAAATLLSKINGEGGRGKPSAQFGDIVGEFDRINSHLVSVGVNKGDGYVSPMAATVLVHHFAPLRKAEISDQVNEATKTEAFANNVYREPDDADLMRDWLDALASDNCPTEEEKEFQREVANDADLSFVMPDTLKERNL